MTQILSRLIATVFGVGYAPKASGTFGSLVALPIVWLLHYYHADAYTMLALAIIIFFAGVWATHKIIANQKDKDPSIVVVDEVVGQMISFGLVWSHLGAPFAPALYQHERIFIKSIVFTSTTLFIFGVIFCLFIILPLIIDFGISFSSEKINAVFGISNIINLSFWLTLSFGLMFQMPIITYSLIKSGFVEYKTFENMRPYVVVIILIIAGILTPPDIISQILLFTPTYMLFEAGLLFSKLRIKKDPNNG